MVCLMFFPRLDYFHKSFQIYLLLTAPHIPPHAAPLSQSYSSCHQVVHGPEFWPQSHPSGHAAERRPAARSGSRLAASPAGLGCVAHSDVSVIHSIAQS